MPRVSATCEVETPQALLGRYYPNGKLGGLTIDGQPPAALGQRVRLTVLVRQPTREFELQGVVAWARRKGSKSLVACYGVDFETGEDAARNRLLSFASDKLRPEALRTEHRVHVELPVKVLHGDTERKEQLVDLSSGGAFIRTRDTLDLGTLVTLSVRAPMTLVAMQLEGRVAWVRRGGPSPGIGVEFTDPDGKQRNSLAKLLAKLRE